MGTEIRSGFSGTVVRGRGLTTKRHEGGFSENGNVLYLNCGDS